MSFITYELGEIVSPRIRVNIPGLRAIQDLGDYILYKATYDCAEAYFAVDQHTKEIYHVIPNFAE